MSELGLPDQMSRDRFINEICENFSVVAPAGVGKTTAITDKIANFVVSAARAQANQLKFPKMAAVTYTEKAAKEIKDRALKKVSQLTASCQTFRKKCLDLADSIFFGTIHAFAAFFLKNHSFTIGLPATFDILEDDEHLWENFLSHFGDVLRVIPEKARNDFVCACDIDELLVMARGKKNPPAPKVAPWHPMPHIDLEAIFKYQPRKNESKTQNFIKLLEEWDFFRKSGHYYPIPKAERLCSSDTFVSFYRQELRDFLSWQRGIQDFFVHSIAMHYKNFRSTNGKLLYEDLINLANDSLRKSSIIDEIEKDPYRIILDEAQDTDLQQFRFLLGVAQKNLREGISLDIQKNFPPPGYFSMVGDPQQAIYSSRTDLTNYINTHNLLVCSGNATELIFSVTMRCSSAVIDFINTNFPKIFADVKFVPLAPRPSCPTGQVKIIKPRKIAKEEVFAPGDHMVEVFSKACPQDFGANVWSDIAVLAPRKEWLMDIYKTFTGDKNLPSVQLHFENKSTNHARPIQWFTSCLRYINNPADKRELAGILRELFGQKSQEIINYFKYNNGEVCKKIDEKFSDLRNIRYSLPMAKFFIKILDVFKIFPRIASLGPHSTLSKDYAQMLELFYFAEAAQMNYIEAEEFFTKKMRAPDVAAAIDQEALQFATFHKSKGLEWPVVILPFMYRGRRLMRAKEDDAASTTEDESLLKAYNNECRLLYVACTRAKNRLYLVDDSEVFGKNLRSNMISSGTILFPAINTNLSSQAVSFE